MCDTLVALGNSTKDGTVVFGKNSDRPQNEAQLITYNPGMDYPKGEEVECTYLTIPQVSRTHAVILSQPFWMFGAEMAANEYGVVIGNEAVYTKESYRNTGLLGMDLLRLGVERGKSAKEALNVITKLMETYGQGGDCSFEKHGWKYHNAFLIADQEEAYVLDTADNWWIVEKVNDLRSLSNNLSVRGKGDMRCQGIIQHAIDKDYCRDDSDFDFARIFSDPQIPNKFPPNTRDGCTLNLLHENLGSVTPALMMEFLREHAVGICMHGSFQSTGSQVSHLKKEGNTSIHWFTGGTIPCLNIFKPYIFTDKDQKFSVNKPAPYTEIKSEWFWSKHKSATKKYKKLPVKPEKQWYGDKLADAEKSIISEINKITQQGSTISNNDFVNKIIEINHLAWALSEQMIEP